MEGESMSSRMWQAVYQGFTPKTTLEQSWEMRVSVESSKPDRSENFLNIKCDFSPPLWILHRYQLSSLRHIQLSLNSFSVSVSVSVSFYLTRSILTFFLIPFSPHLCLLIPSMNTLRTYLCPPSIFCIRFAPSPVNLKNGDIDEYKSRHV